MQIKDKNELAFFERISKCIIFDISGRRAKGMQNDEFCIKALTECIYSAYVECVKDKIDIKCQDFVRVVYHLGELRRIARVLLADPNFYAQYKDARIGKSLCSFSKSYLETDNPNYEVYADLKSATKMFLNDYAEDDMNDYAEDDVRKKIPRLYQSLIELDATEADASVLCSLIHDFERRVKSDWRDFLMDSRNKKDSRVIAKLFKLGAYASVDGWESNFGYYVEKFLGFSYIMNH